MSFWRKVRQVPMEIWSGGCFVLSLIVNAILTTLPAYPRGLLFLPWLLVAATTGWILAWRMADPRPALILKVVLCLILALFGFAIAADLAGMILLAMVANGTASIAIIVYIALCIWRREAL